MMKKLLLIAAAAAAICACTPQYDEGEVSYKIWKNFDGYALPDDFSALGEPTVTGTGKSFRLDEYVDPAEDHFVAEFTSVMTVPNEREYSFMMYSDDNSRLFIDSEPVISLNATGSYTAFKQTLKKGKHELKIQYQEYINDQGLDLYLLKDGELPRDYGTTPSEYQVPDFVIPQVTEAHDRYMEWKGDDETVIFPIFTDVHAHTDLRFRHIGYVGQTSDIWDYDFMLCLGDVGVNIGPAHISKDITNTILESVSGEMKKYPGLFLYAPGNHDWDGGEGTFTSEERFQELFQKPGLEKAGGNLHLTDGKVYHYYDIPEKNFRIILLNSCGTGTQQDQYYVFDDEQVEWFRKTVSDTPKDMSILVCCHYMPHPSGRWHNIPAPYTLASNERMMDVLADLKKDHNIIGLFSGDSHFNMHEVDRNVNYFVTQGMGYCTPEQLMPGTRRADVNFNESLCCDVIAVKPAKNEVHTFRIGAGGADFDYAFPY